MNVLVAASRSINMYLKVFNKILKHNLLSLGIILNIVKDFIAGNSYRLNKLKLGWNDFITSTLVLFSRQHVM